MTAGEFNTRRVAPNNVKEGAIRREGREAAAVAKRQRLGNRCRPPDPPATPFHAWEAQAPAPLSFKYPAVTRNMGCRLAKARGSRPAPARHVNIVRSAGGGTRDAYLMYRQCLR